MEGSATGGVELGARPMTRRFSPRSAIAALAIMLALSLIAGRARAELSLDIAGDGTDRIVLVNTDRFMERLEIEGLNNGSVVARIASCDDLGSRLAPAAAQVDWTTSASLYARYNLVNLWLDNLCRGKSDSLPSAKDATAWLTYLVGIRRQSDGAPFLKSHEMQAQLFLFGAPGAPADDAAAIQFLNADAPKHPGDDGLYLAYAYLHGLGVMPDAATAQQWIDKAADAGSYDAKILRIQDEELGLTEPRDESSAFARYLALSSANTPVIWFRLGLMYLDGRGTTRDPCLAEAWLTKAATHLYQPIAQAKLYLERIHANGLCKPS